jgi:hypothetical protein
VGYVVRPPTRRRHLARSLPPHRLHKRPTSHSAQQQRAQEAKSNTASLFLLRKQRYDCCCTKNSIRSHKETHCSVCVRMPLVRRSPHLLRTLVTRRHYSTTSIMSSASYNGAVPFQLSKDDTVHFDPTSIGLPANWSLTDWSDLKG